MVKKEDPEECIHLILIRMAEKMAGFIRGVKVLTAKGSFYSGAIFLRRIKKAAVGRATELSRVDSPTREDLPFVQNRRIVGSICVHVGKELANVGKMVE